ncbi:sigma-70 family RNA polymerase sigma factor [Rehaibacterium terrae]|uniref:RNA polymerase sigma factor (Sigma-70 family) n=1 Tax=Rehaibacterium terrae TaxID=1341696 RepID=A0A7W7XXZ2_9GAMM|nr:sigma-70 family RNA polymerase sigma factor [Rehaibacterium terrae]MBB5014304.1 RNA polymerase sigma factor (sigma-70 family) [Rehaibacterium terrae]
MSRLPVSPPPAAAIDESTRLVHLVARLCERDQAALGELYDRTVDRVYGTAIRVLGRPEDAEEVVCEVYQQVWEGAGHYDPGRGGVLAWLLRIAWSRAVDRLRRERAHRSRLVAHPQDALDTYTLCEENDPASRLMAVLDSRSAVAHALETLSVEQRRMLALAFFEDLSHPEIAARTGVALGTVKSHIRRGLQALRRALGEGAAMTDRRRLDPDLAARLAESMTPVTPDPARRLAMRERILADAAAPATRVLRADEGEWREFVHGIRIKTLRRDETAGTETSLWRLAPGARVPPHSHRHEEECLVLEGSIVHDGVEYFAGDYLLAPAGARHKPFVAPQGALLLIRSELVPRLGWLTRLALRLIGR